MARFDWDKAGPSKKALAALERVKDDREFPNTYSGQSWRAAWRIWKVYRTKPAELDAIGPYDDIPGADLDGLDLTGFMVGWAMNAVRQMLGRRPGPNGALVTIGTQHQPAVPASGAADDDLRTALGGKPRRRRKGTRS